MDEQIATIEGCIAILEELSEESADPRIWTMISALRWTAESLEAADESCHVKKES